MKMKRLFILIIILLFTVFLSSCELFPKFTASNTTQINTTYPTKVDGTISFIQNDYDKFPVYHSSTYDLTDISEYNNILNQTKEHIKHTNIFVQSTLYEMRKVYPWDDTLTKFIVGASNGSGFVFMEDENYYYFITNYHVVNPKDYDASYEIEAYGDKTSQDAILVNYDESLDLAVMKFLKNAREDIEQINIYQRLYYKFNSEELVLAIGNPLGLIDNVTFGKYNSLEKIENADYDVIYHSASINEGSSGGALVDVDGNLLGVNSWGSTNNDELSFAIPNYIVYMFLINSGVLS